METATVPGFRQRFGYSAVLLGIVAMVAGTALTVAHFGTADAIAARQTEDRQASLREVVPANVHDNDLLKDTLILKLNRPNEGMGPITFYRAMAKGQVTGIAFELTAIGYSGPIRLLMAVAADGKILGVRVLQQSETPGLGDKIDIKKSNWILGFNGHSLKNPGERGWHVKKDGGIFDQFTGATITPRGVVKGIHAGLELVAAHRAELFAAPSKTSPAEAPHG